MSTQQKVINQIKQDFLTNDNQVINKALSITRAKGNEQLILPLIELYKSTQEEGIKKEIKSIFSELKKKNVLDILLPELENGNNDVKELILFSIWSSAMDMTDHIPLLVETCISGNFMVILEGLTVLENLEGPFNEDDLFQASTLLQETLYEKSQSKEKDLIQSMYDIILEFAKTY